MIALLARFLRPYRGPLALVVALLFVQSLANLYLQSNYQETVGGATGYDAD